MQFQFLIISQQTTKMIRLSNTSQHKRAAAIA